MCPTPITPHTNHQPLQWPLCLHIPHQSPATAVATVPSHPTPITSHCSGHCAFTSHTSHQPLCLHAQRKQPGPHLRQPRTETAPTSPIAPSCSPSAPPHQSPAAVPSRPTPVTSPPHLRQTQTETAPTSPTAPSFHVPHTNYAQPQSPAEGHRAVLSRPTPILPAPHLRQRKDRPDQAACVSQPLAEDAGGADVQEEAA